MTDDALSRLLAGLDADERIARAATKLPQPTVKFPQKRPPWEPERWEIDRFGDLATVNGDRNPIHDEGGVRDDDTAAHMARWDPKRALSELCLKQLVLKDHRPQQMDDGAYCVECSTSLSLNIDQVPWPCEYIEALTSIYTEEGK